MIDVMAKSGRWVYMKKERKEKLMLLKKTIKESIRQGRLKSLRKLVQRYFSMLKPMAAENNNNLDYRFYKQRTGR
jgi:hypothetical protein